MTKVRKLLRGLPDRVGPHRVGDDAVVEILGTRSEKVHTHIRGVWPPTTELEHGFSTGPLFTFKVRNAIADVRTGAIFDASGAIIRESFGTRTNIDKYVARLTEAPRPTAELQGLSLPIESPRSNNFCRWWLDTMSKAFLTQESGGDMRPVRTIAVAPRSRFQSETLALLDDVTMQPEADRYVQGDFVSSSGLTFGGGQRLAAAVTAFGAAMGRRLHDAAPDHPRRPERILISRRDAGIRQVVDEDAVFAALEPLGFVRIDLALLSVLEQHQFFAAARIIVSPHGAGLTNLLWSRPDCALVEIFPEGGVHGSAFLRIASQKQMPYYAFVGAAGRNRDGGGNMNNADIIIDPADLEAFVASAVLGESRAPRPAPAVGVRTEPVARLEAAAPAPAGAPLPGLGRPPLSEADAEEAARRLLTCSDIYEREDKAKYKTARRFALADGRTLDLGEKLWSAFRQSIQRRSFGEGAAPPALRELPTQKRLLAIELLLRITDKTRRIYLNERGLAETRRKEAVEAGLNRFAIDAFGDSQRQRNSIRPHHVSLLADGKFVLRSPVSGRLIESRSSLLIYDQRGVRIRPNILYYFEDGEPIIAVEDSLFGDIWCLYLPERNLSVVRRDLSPANIISTLAALTIEEPRALASYLDRTLPRRRALLVSAIEHLGHSVLGDFEGLSQCGRDGLLNHVDVVAKGVVAFYDEAKLFPELAGKPTLGVGLGREAFLRSLENDLLLVRPVSTTLWFSKGLKARFRRMFEAVGDAPTPGPGPVVWFELRTNDRYWVDQLEGYVHIAQSLAAEHPGLVVLLAGWSLPPPGSRTADDLLRIEADTRLGAEIKARLPHLEVIDVIGVSPMEKGSWACRIDTHVSTFGSGVIFPNGMAGRSGVMLINDVFANSLEAKHVKRGSMSVIEEPGHTHYIVVESIERPEGKDYDRCFVVDWRLILERLREAIAQRTASA